MKKVTRHEEQASRYLELLAREIELQGRLFDHDREVVQLHFGGGTPTYHDDTQLHDLMAELGRHFSLSEDESREFSIEVDPRTVGGERLAHLAAIGFNRISLGVQDIDPKVQAAVNRIQDPEATPCKPSKASRAPSTRWWRPDPTGWRSTTMPTCRTFSARSA
jgi:oxygen-independent coproporphyrinogen-3 oxidase